MKSLSKTFSALLTCLVALAYAPLYAQENNQPPEGFLAIFNGVDLKGWGGGETKDPEWFSTLDYDTWDDYAKKMKEKVEQHWRVEDGVLISDGKGRTSSPTGTTVISRCGSTGPCQQAATQASTFATARRFNSGTRITSCVSTRLDKGSGGLWNNKKAGKDPGQLADNPIGEWNRMYIRMVGPYVTVILNGKKVIDNVELENYHRDQPVYSEGPIHLQTHGSETRFKNTLFDASRTPRQTKSLARSMAAIKTISRRCSTART